MGLKRGAHGTVDRIQWDDGSGLRHVLYSAVSGQPGTEKHRERMEVAVNEALVFKQLIADLPADDPDKTIDPDHPRIFWGDADGKKTAVLPADQTYLVSRHVTVTVDSWDGTKYICTTRRV